MSDVYQNFFRSLQNLDTSNPIDDIEKSRLYYLIGKEIHESANDIQNQEDLVPILQRAKEKLGRELSVEANLDTAVDVPDPTSQNQNSSDKTKPPLNTEQANAAIRYDKTTKITYLNDIALLYLPVLMEQEILKELNLNNDTETTDRLASSGVRFGQDVCASFLPEDEIFDNEKRWLRIGFSFHKLCGLGRIIATYEETQVKIEIESERFQHPLAQHFSLGFIQELFRLVYQQENFNQVANVPECEILDNKVLTIQFEIYSDVQK
ncbi:MAG: hypothetical protein ABUK01_02645 [Leptospirales bacterium]